MGTTRKLVFGLAEGVEQDAQLLGGKGYGLSVMHSIGIPVPPAVVVSTAVARSFRQYKKLPERLGAQLSRGLRALEGETGKRYGDADNPLLVSVRSGAAVSMPGMMETILNLGLNAEITERWAQRGAGAFAWESYARFLTMFGGTVFDISKDKFAEALKLEKLDVRCRQLERVISQEIGRPFPDDPKQQLALAVVAVLNSWNSERAILYRKENNIPDYLGTAVTIQTMVFGNADTRSGTGVVFSRDVATGEKVLYGEWLEQAQGEDIVSGERTPRPIGDMLAWDVNLYRQLEKIVSKLEEQLNDVVDVEFTVESGTLYILQVRSAKRTPEAAMTIATQMVWEKRWSKEDALLRTRKESRRYSGVSFDAAHKSQYTPAGTGLPASPGVVVGRAAFSSQRAVEMANEERDEDDGSIHTVVLVRPDTSPDDLSGMLASGGILTATGGMTSHAAVVARGMAKPAVVGMNGLVFEDDDKVTFPNGMTLGEGDYLSIDGSTGEVFSLALKTTARPAKKEVNIFLKWVKESEPPIPEPKVDFEAIKKSQSENQLINDFYMADAMFLAAEGTAMEPLLLEHRMDVHVRAAQDLAAYLIVACAGELRHSWSSAAAPGDEMHNHMFGNKGCGCPLCLIKGGAVEKMGAKGPLVGVAAVRERLRTYFGISKGGARSATQNSVITVVKGLENGDLLQFLEWGMTAFKDLRWGGGYGGKKWAAVAHAPIRYLRGELGHSLFADHVFDLQHNNGSVFGKHKMFCGNREKVHAQLEEKKTVSGVTQLRAKMGRWSPFSDRTNELYEQGKGAGLWG